MFGLAVRSAAPLPGIDPAGAGTPEVEILIGAPGDAERAFSGSREIPERAAATLDGVPWTVERGRDRDVLMRYGDAAVFHLDAAEATLRCGTRDAEDPAFRRVLLDSALTTVSLARGFEALHGGVVAVGARAVAIVGPSGTGKTTLVAELLRRGHRLVADDVAVVTVDPEGCRVHPAPPVMNLPHGTPAPATARVLHDFGDEDWVLVGAAASEPVPLAAIVALDRAAGGAARLEPVAAPAPLLLAHALDSGRDPARRTRRFTLLGDVAGAVAVLRLAAGGATAPADLADLIESTA